MHDRDAYDEDLRNELGYGFASAREVRLREWQDTREDAEFEALCRRLLATKHAKARWQRALQDPAFKAYLDEFKRRYARTPRARERHRQALARFRKRAKEKARGEVFKCLDCGATWCRIARGGPRPKFCSDNCCHRYRWREKHPDARVIRRRGTKRARWHAAPRREGG